MNIFVVSEDFKENAKALDDKRLNKMLLESVQLISTALHAWGLKAPYKATHKNHPCSKWTLESHENFKWLMVQTWHYYQEYVERFQKLHKSGEAFIEVWTRHGFHKATPTTKHTPFVNCTPYKDEPDVFQAYKQTLRDKWASDKRPPKWTKRDMPAFNYRREYHS